MESSKRRKSFLSLIFIIKCFTKPCVIKNAVNGHNYLEIIEEIILCLSQLKTPLRPTDVFHGNSAR